MARTGANGRKTASNGRDGTPSAKVKRPAAAKDSKAPARKSARPKARTASGKKADPATLAAAALGSQEGLRERTEAGHRAAGRTPPSEASAKKTSGATRIVDDDIRSYAGLVTEDQKLLESPKSGQDFTRTDPWRVLRIMGEFI